MIKRSDILSDFDVRKSELPDDYISVDSMVTQPEDDKFVIKKRDFTKNDRIFGSMYSVDSVLSNAPELMNQKLVIGNHDKIREAESVEKELESLSQIKKAYDSLPRVAPGDDSVIDSVES